MEYREECPYCGSRLLFDKLAIHMQQCQKNHNYRAKKKKTKLNLIKIKAEREAKAIAKKAKAMANAEKQKKIKAKKAKLERKRKYAGMTASEKRAAIASDTAQKRVHISSSINGISKKDTKSNQWIQIVSGGLPGLGKRSR